MTEQATEPVPERVVELLCTRSTCEHRWMIEADPTDDVTRISAPCPKCGREAVATGEALVRGVPCRVAHGFGCEGYVLHDLRVAKSKSGRSTLVPELAPCPECRVGHRAVWEAGLQQQGWERSGEAVRVFLQALFDAERPMPSPLPNRLWEKIAKDLT